MPDEITFPKPDDWHLHLRDGEALRAVVGHTAAQFARAIVMPNLKPPVTTVDQALAYRERIRAALPQGSSFDPLMTLYLTDGTTPDEIRRLRESEHVYAVKLYPAGATTNSADGVAELDRLEPVFAAMQEHEVPLLVHGEVTDPSVDVFDREAVFIERHLHPLCERFPRLRVVLEHITTAEGASFVSQGRAGLAGTLTVQHLMLNRNALFSGGLRPHHYCLPVLKRERHRRALLEAAISGSGRFFAGTDSAPHARPLKEQDCGCAGIYTAHAAVEFYAEIFDEAGALERLPDFLSRFGAEFYQLPLNREQVRLERRPRAIPPHYPFGESFLVPFRASGEVPWTLGPA